MTELTVDIGELLDALGIQVQRIDRSEHFASCPLSSHRGADNNPSWSISEDKLLHNCFSCGGGGNVFQLVSDILALDPDETDAWLAPYIGGISDDPDGFIKQIDDLLDDTEDYAPEESLPWFSPAKVTPYVDTPCEWFEERGVSKETRKSLQLGYNPEHLHRRTEYVGPAVIIPHFFNGQLVGWQNRWMDEDRPKSIGKYTNTSNFPRKQTLYNWDHVKNFDVVYVVEGIFTVARLHQLGYPTVATFGASVTDTQLNMLKRFQTVFVCFDNDDAGYIAEQRVVEALEDYVVVKTVEPPPGKGSDLADTTDDDIEARIANAQPGFLKEYDNGIS